MGFGVAEEGLEDGRRKAGSSPNPIRRDHQGTGRHCPPVRARTGGDDADSKWNDLADQLANKAATETKEVRPTDLSEKVVRIGTSVDDVLSGIPLKIMGGPVTETELVKAILANTASLDQKFLSAALISALKKTLQSKAYDLEKAKIHGAVAYKLVEKTHLTIEKLEE